MALPEVQDMLRKLADYKLGIFMPHMHDEQTGDLQSMPDELMQVESSLNVSFKASKEIAGQTDRFIPVGWAWRAGAIATVTACEMVRGDTPDEAGRYVKHKMVNGN
jgi:hypothetical protein